MDPSSLSKPSPEQQGLPLSNVAGSTPKTESTSTPTKEQIKEIAKKSIPTPKEGLELLEKQITDANQVLQEFYKLAKAMHWEHERDFDPDKTLFNIKDSKADFDLKSKKVITPKPMDILKFLVGELNRYGAHPDGFIQLLKLNEGNYPLLKKYFKNLEEFVAIVKKVNENDGHIAGEPLRQIIAIANKNSSDLLLLIPLMHRNLSKENFVKVIKQLIRENLGDNDVPFLKGSIVLEALTAESIRIGKTPIDLDDFWDKDYLSQETFFEKISLNVPGLLRTMADFLSPRYSTETLKYFLEKCDNKNMAWQVVLEKIFYEELFISRSDLEIESFLNNNWPPEEKALKDFIDSFMKKYPDYGSFERMVTVLSNVFRQHKSDDFQNYLNSCLWKKIIGLLEMTNEDLCLWKNRKELQIVKMIFSLKIFPKDVMIKACDLLIEKFEKIVGSKIQLKQEIEQINKQGASKKSFRQDFSEETEDFSSDDFINRSEVIRKEDILELIPKIEEALEGLKQAKEILQQQP